MTVRHVALIDADGVVVNNILAEDGYKPPAGLEAVTSGENIEVGMRFNRETRSFPVEPVLSEGSHSIRDSIKRTLRPEAPGKIVELGEPVLGSDGWSESWVVRDPTPRELADRAAALQAQVDEEAEAQRLLFVTAGAGQALEYGETNRELAALQDDSDPDPKNYPYLMADQGILGETLQEIAAKIKQMVANWHVAGPMIKRLRRQAKVSIQAAEAAGDLIAMEKAAQIDWSAITDIQGS